ncbi:hypothetical protein ARMGADRAFT_1063919 [Armillaria gallica]|uniref:Fungal calcium binding protein domain-containing protein n=1 Tax=Armillaria gallica TaxID=47427 RepID=A0A2H3DSA1_ARMGA|nr:hypothetical protein ARMGADRAFT_1063919 [Armillaria gallica]
MFIRSLSLLSLVTFTIANGLGDGNALQDAFDTMDGTFDNIRGALSVFSTNVDVSHATDHLDGKWVCDAVKHGLPIAGGFLDGLAARKDDFKTVGCTANICLLLKTLVRDSDVFDKKFFPAAPASSKACIEKYQEAIGAKLDKAFKVFLPVVRATPQEKGTRMIGHRGKTLTHNDSSLTTTIISQVPPRYSGLREPCWSVESYLAGIATSSDEAHACALIFAALCAATAYSLLAPLLGIRLKLIRLPAAFDLGGVNSRTIALLWPPPSPSGVRLPGKNKSESAAVACYNYTVVPVYPLAPALSARRYTLLLYRPTSIPVPPISFSSFVHKAVGAQNQVALCYLAHCVRS